MKKIRNEELADLWSFPWPIMEVLLGGKSSVDLQEIHLTSWEEANRFLECYGFNLDRPEDQQALHECIIEALCFIERHLMPTEWESGIRPPQEILLCDDPRHLLLWASDHSLDQKEKSTWACAVLRVMHTINHIHILHKIAELDMIRDQIMNGIREHIFRDAKGNLWFGGKNDKVRLERVDWKYEKTRESILLKLLHKTGNVAETIYDLLGVRIVTQKLCDVLKVLKFLDEFYIVSYPNCIPSRGRNTLVDIERFRTQLTALREMLLSGSISTQEFETMIARLTAPIRKKASFNPHSASNYRSIQVTCRQLIRQTNPFLGWLKRLEDIADDAKYPKQKREFLKEVTFFIKNWQGIRENLTISAFFPFEIQIMDSEASKYNRLGNAAHDCYKAAQIKTARKRVLNRVLQLY